MIYEWYYVVTSSKTFLPDNSNLHHQAPMICRADPAKELLKFLKALGLSPAQLVLWYDFHTSMGYDPRWLS